MVTSLFINLQICDVVEEPRPAQFQGDADYEQTSSLANSDEVMAYGVDIESSSYYQKEAARATRIEGVIERDKTEKKSGRSEFSALITSLLEEFLDLGKLDGLTIVTDEGLVVAQTCSFNDADVMAAIGSVFEYVAQRAEDAKIVSIVDEMVIKGFDGELAVVRYFPNLEHRFFLMAYARQSCAYRKVTNLVLKRCGQLLEKRFGTNNAPELDS